MAGNDWVNLADAVRALRQELKKAIAEGQGQGIRFELGAVEMEFLLEVSREGGGQAGINFWVVSVSGRGAATSGSTHRVTLALKPVDDSGASPLIAGTEPGDPDR